MPYKDWGASDVLTAADLKTYCENQSVITVPTTSSVTWSPVIGNMLAETADATSGVTLKQYASAGTGWRPPWNLPWGLVVRTASTGNGTAWTTSTFQNQLTSASWTAVQNRRYKITAKAASIQVNTGPVDLVVSTQLQSAALGYTNSHYTDMRNSYAGASNVAGIFHSHVYTHTGATTAVSDLLVKAAYSWSTGTPTGFFVHDGATLTYDIMVEDIGPSGAPA